MLYNILSVYVDEQSPESFMMKVHIIQKPKFALQINGLVSVRQEPSS